VKTGTIIFDLDGTLIDAVELHALSFQHAFREAGVEVDMKSIRDRAGMKGEEIVARLASPDKAKEIYQRKSEWFLENLDKVNELPGATRVLETLRQQGHHLAMATSGNRRVLEAVCRKFGWTFGFSVTGDEVTRGKPDPEMLLKVKTALPGPYVFVGDTEYDRQAGETAGIRTLLLGGELKSLDDLTGMKLF